MREFRQARGAIKARPGAPPAEQLVRMARNGVDVHCPQGAVEALWDAAMNLASASGHLSGSPLAKLAGTLSDATSALLDHVAEVTGARHPYPHEIDGKGSAKSDQTPHSPDGDDLAEMEERRVNRARYDHLDEPLDIEGPEPCDHAVCPEDRCTLGIDGKGSAKFRSDSARSSDGDR